MNEIAKFAVSYHAFCAAVQSADHNGVLVWGPMLRELQKKFGVTLNSEDCINACISSAHNMLALKEAEAKA